MGAKVNYDAISALSDVSLTNLVDNNILQYNSTTSLWKNVTFNHASNHTDDTDDIQNATSGQKGLATAAQITKLDGIETSADVNNISDANATDLTDSGETTLHYHDSDRQTLAQTLALGVDANDLDTTSWARLSFFDASIYIEGGADGVLDIEADSTLNLGTTSTTVNIGQSGTTVNIGQTGSEIICAETIRSDSDLTDDVGSETVRWNKIFAGRLNLSNGGVLADDATKSIQIVNNLSSTSSPTGIDLDIDYSGATDNLNTYGILMNVASTSGGTASTFGTSIIVSGAGQEAFSFKSILTGTATTKIGVDIIVTGASTNNIGFSGQSSGGTNNYGAYLSGSTADLWLVNRTLKAGATYTWPASDGNNGDQLTTDSNGNLSWAVAGGGGADTALSNLASVAINTALLPDADGTIDLGAVGGSDFRFRHLYLSGNLSDETNTLTIANAKAAYDHSQDNNQAHTDYLKNNASDSTSGTLTVTGGLISGSTIKSDADNTDDLGATTTARWKDLYLSGNLDDDTNQVTVANLKTSYDHSQDNAQAHTDYLLNNNSDSTSGTLTATGGFISGSTVRSDTANTDDLGTSSIGWRFLYLDDANSTNPSTNGQICYDSNPAALTTYDTHFVAAAKVIPTVLSKSMTIQEPDLLSSSTFPLFECAEAITIVKWVGITAAGAYTLTLQEHSSTGVYQADIDSVTIDNDGASDTSISNPGIDAGDYVYAALPATDVDWIHLTIYYYING